MASVREPLGYVSDGRLGLFQMASLFLQVPTGVARGARREEAMAGSGCSTRHGRLRPTRRPEEFSHTSSTAPHLKSGRYAHQRPVVVGEPAQLYDKVIHLATGRQPGAHHRLP